MAAEVTGICLGTIAGGQNAEGRYSGQYQFNVTVNAEAKDWGPRKVILESSALSMAPNFGVPDIWDTLDIGGDVDADIYCLGKDATWQEEAKDGSQLWSVSASFGPLSSAGLIADDLDTSPVLRLARWRLDWEDYTELLTVEPETHPDTAPPEARGIINAATDPFIPSPTIQRQRKVWVFNIALGSESSVNTFASDYGGRVNKVNWTDPGGVHLGLPTVPKLAALMRSISVGEKIEEQGFNFYPVELRVAIKGSDEIIPTWTFRYLNQGTRELLPAGDKVGGIDDNGIPHGDLMNLDTDGQQLADNLEPIFWPDGTTGTGEFFMGYKTAIFNNIPFPT
jgi:hypothetical protein